MKRLKKFLAIFLIFALLCPFLPIQRVAAAESKNGYLSLADAAEAVRKKLASQSKTVYVKFYLEDPRVYGRYTLTNVLLEEAYKHTGVPDEGDYLKWSFQNFGWDETEEFDGKTHYVNATITVTEYNADAKQEKELDEKLAQVMDFLDLDGKSDYEKIKAIYRYVCENVHYSPEVLTSDADPMLPSPELSVYYSAYGALVLGSTTCQGYGSLLYRMLLEAGIDCRMIAGDSHGWNIVKLDGKYYYLDATYDEGDVEDPQYFLLGSASFREEGHESWYYQYNEEFLDAYPISVLDYGEEDLSANDASTVIGSGKCGNQATWELTADGHMTISGTGSMWDKSTYDCYHWPGLNGYIKTVEIQDGITSIGNYAFYNCPQLTDIVIADSVSTIGRDAFALCEGLTQITIPDTVRSVGVRAFYQCVRLETATLSSGMKTIPTEMFIGCTSLKTVQIPEGIQTIDEAAFAVCYSLGEIQFPTSLTTLGVGVFCESFDPDEKVSLTLPETITSIGWACFEDSGLYEVVWNAKTKTVEMAMFHACPYLEKLTFCDAVTVLKEATVAGCPNLKTLTLPAKLEKLGHEAIYDCVSLKELVLPETLREMGDTAIHDCDSLRELTFPAALTQMGKMYFWLNDNLRTVTFKGSAPRIVSEKQGIVTFPEESILTICYPEDDPSWTEAYRQSLAGGAVKWRGVHSAGAEHTFKGYGCDSENHWNTCTGCAERYDMEAHAFTSGCARECEICKYTRTPPHNFTDEWKYDENEHWHKCADCMNIRDEAKHQFDEGKTEGNICTYTCLDCGFAKTEDLPVEPTTVPTEVTQPQQDQPEGDHTVILVVVILVAACLGGAGVVVFLQKKKSTVG